MSLSDFNVTARFSNRVENYQKFRPAYPPELIEFLRGELGLNRNSIVADIGSGTGIFAKMLLDANCTVFGVEPNREMRAAGAEFLKDFDKFTSVDGAAENTNLPDDSVDFITAAQAFHWFKPERARDEFKRILRRNGFVVLIWNLRNLDANVFSREYESFLIEYGDDYQKIRLNYAHEHEIAAFFDNDLKTKNFQNAQTLDLDGLTGRTLSSSFMPTETDVNFEPMTGALETLFEKHERDGKITIYYDTKVFYKQF